MPFLLYLAFFELLSREFGISINTILNEKIISLQDSSFHNQNTAYNINS